MSNAIKVSVKGVLKSVPSFDVCGRRLVYGPGWLKVATIFDELWLPEHSFGDCEELVRSVRDVPNGIDILSFGQRLPKIEREFNFHTEWDNMAVANTIDYDSWWNSLPQSSRKNVRRSERRGVEVALAEFDDVLVRGIKEIYDETPYRQGRKFWHFGKDIETVRRENSSYLDRSKFVVAYFKGQLVGFTKLVFTRPSARIMQIVALDAHADKRVTNALLAKSVEVCCENSIHHLIYGKYIYGNKADSPMTEFKSRNGFMEVLTPQYFVPISLKGKVALGLRLHRGLRPLLPNWAVSYYLKRRAGRFAKISERRRNGSTGDAAGVGL